MLPRYQLLELHEQSWIPSSLRSDLQIGLSTMVRTLRLYHDVWKKLQHWVQTAQVDEILDLCSGAGGPAQTLVEASLAATGDSPRMILSDLYPQEESMQSLCEKYPKWIQQAPEPVDATSVGSAGYNGEGKVRARSLIACFHHFPPELATQMVQDAIHHRAPVLILEPMTRSVQALLNATVGSGFLVPLLRLTQKPRSPGTFLRFPLNALQCLFDGMVSVMRTYTPEEIRAMTDVEGSDYVWEIGVEKGLTIEPFPTLHHITYALGTPRERLL